MARRRVLIGRPRLALFAMAAAGPFLLIPVLLRPELALLAGVAVGGLWLASRSVAYPLALGGLHSVIVSLAGGQIGPTGTIPLLVLGWTAAGVGFALLRGGSSLPPRILLAVPVLATVMLWIFMAARLDGSPGVEYGTLKVQLFAENAIVICAAAAIASRRRDFDLFMVLTLLVATTGAIVLVLQLVSGGVAVRGEGRESLQSVNPIILGRNAGLGLLVAVHLLMTSRHAVLRACALGAVPVLAVALFTSGSRGPLMATILGLLVLFALLTRGAGRRRLPALALGAGLGLLLVRQLVPAENVARGLSVLDGDNPIDPNGRDALWSQGYEIFAAEPLTGVGTGGFSGMSAASYPHNLFLEVGAELGIIGLVLLGCVLVGGLRALLSVRRSRSGDRETAAFVLALLATAFWNAMVSGALHTNAEVWLAVGLAVGLEARTQRVRAPAPEWVRGIRPVPMALRRAP